MTKPKDNQSEPSQEEQKSLVLAKMRKRYYQAIDDLVDNYAAESPYACHELMKLMDSGLRQMAFEIKILLANGPAITSERLLNMKAADLLAETAGRLEEESRYLQEPLRKIGEAIDSALSKVADMLPAGKKYISTKDYINLMAGSATLAAALTDMHKMAASRNSPTLN